MIDPARENIVIVRILLAIILNALALAAAAFLVPGIYVDGAEQGTGATILAFLFVGAVFGLVNVVIKPIISLLSLPITCLTLGLFAVVINAGMLMLTAWLTSWTPVHFVVADFFWSAVLGSIVVALVSALLNQFILRPLNT
ncbi:phage holin family protein [Nesterenkonia sandarakina]